MIQSAQRLLLQSEKRGRQSFARFRETLVQEFRRIKRQSVEGRKGNGKVRKEEIFGLFGLFR